MNLMMAPRTTPSGGHTAWDEGRHAPSTTVTATETIPGTATWEESKYREEGGVGSPHPHCHSNGYRDIWRQLWTSTGVGVFSDPRVCLFDQPKIH